MEYKTLKDITAAAVYNAGGKSCEEFEIEFQKFLKWAWDYYVNNEEHHQDQLHFFLPIGFDGLHEQFEEHPKWRDFLVEHGFIEETRPEVFYHVGQRFKHVNVNGEYALSAMNLGDRRLVALINCSCRMSWASAIDVGRVDRITEEEFDRITGVGDARNFVEIKE